MLLLQPKQSQAFSLWCFSFLKSQINTLKPPFCATARRPAPSHYLGSPEDLCFMHKYQTSFSQKSLPTSCSWVQASYQAAGVLTALRQHCPIPSLPGDPKHTYPQDCQGKTLLLCFHQVENALILKVLLKRHPPDDIWPFYLRLQPIVPSLLILLPYYLGLCFLQQVSKTGMQGVLGECSWSNSCKEAERQGQKEREAGIQHGCH